MKMPGTVNILFLSLLLSSCSLPPKVESHYDSDFDFSGLKHYRWFELPGDVEADAMTIQRLRDAVDREMEKKGYSLSSESPDFSISLQGFKDSTTQGAVPKASYQRGIASGIQKHPSPDSMRGREFKRTSYNTVVYEAGNLTLTIFSAPSDQLIWEGVATGLIKVNNSPEIREQRTNKTITRLLANFPPTEN